MITGFSVQSRQLSIIGHDEKSSRLYVAFFAKNGNYPFYEYQNISKGLFEQLVKADSRGSFFIKQIKNDPTRYQFTKMNVAPAAFFGKIEDVANYGAKKLPAFDPSAYEINSSNCAWCW